MDNDELFKYEMSLVIERFNDITSILNKYNLDDEDRVLIKDKIDSIIIHSQDVGKVLERLNHK